MSTAAKKNWWKRDAAPGVLLLAATLLSFLLLNSLFAAPFHAALHTQLASLSLGGVTVKIDVLHAINDGFMAVFFLYVGLELKRECAEGPFRNPSAAALPIAAAIGGMAAPALVYLAVVSGAGGDYARGWAIPAATDIAFAMGVLSLLGSRAPAGLRLFLIALAIVDDLGAILIIAFFYTQSITGWALGGAFTTFGAMLLLNRAGVSKLLPYWILAITMWGFTLFSGVHATVAGVLAAMAIPMRDGSGGSPLVAAEHALKPYALLVVMPLFALANAGLPIAGMTWKAFVHPVSLGAGLGLIVGKPIGIAIATFAAAAALRRRLPAAPLQMLGAAMIGGIGFTMSLFIGSLAFGEGPSAGPMRLGVVAGSLVSASLGLALLVLGKGEPGDPELAEQEHRAEEEGIIDER